MALVIPQIMADAINEKLGVRPVDNKSKMEGLKLQYDMGAISQESIVMNSPYTQNVEREMELLGNEINHNDNGTVIE